MPHFCSPVRLAGAAALLAGALLPAVALAQAPTKLVEVKTTQGVARFSTDVTGGMLAGGEYDGDNSLSKIPQEGSGTRLMWYPAKAAFRVGYINGTQWDATNIGSYSMALGQNARASGDFGFAAGKDVIAANSGTVALGEFCTAAGTNSVALGYHANTRTATGTSTGGARQGSFVFADRSVADNNSNTDYSDEYYAEADHAAQWRVTGGFRVVTGGTTSSLTGYMPTRGVSILPGTTTSFATNWGQPTALIATSSGAYLSSAGVWTNTSDRNRKHRFEPVSGEDVLARLRRVPLTSWSYKADAACIRHLGPMAQDFRRAFGLGQDSISIGTVDADGVALAGVQALDARTLKQEKQLAALQAENHALRARLDALDQRAAAPSQASLPLWATLLVASLGLGALLLRRPAGQPAS